MGRYRLRLCVLLAACLLVLAACGEETPPPPAPLPTPTPSASPAPEPVEFALASYPGSSFHPAAGDNRTNLNLGGLLYEGLFALDQQFQVRPVLCQSYTVSEDARAWTFVLKPDVSFSDGSPLTAAVAAAALEEARTSPLYASRLADVTAVRPGEGSVTITLRTPNGNLPALLDIPISKGGGERPLGTGPYLLEETEEGLRLRARPDRAGTLPREVIPLYGVQAADELIQAFDTRAVALVSTDLTGSSALGFSGSYETIDYPPSPMVFVGFQTERGPCRDSAVRRALQRAADREVMTSVLLARHAVPAALPAAPGSVLYHDDVAQAMSFSPAEAEEILSAGGWLPEGEDGVRQKGQERLELTLVVSGDNAGRVALAEQMAETLKNLGMAVTVRRLPWESYLEALSRGEFDLYLGEVRMTADFDPSALMAPGGVLNYGGYAAPQVQEALDSFRAASGQARTLAAKNLYRRLAEDPPFVVLCFKNWSVLIQWKQISGLTPTQQNIFDNFAQWNIARYSRRS